MHVDFFIDHLDLPHSFLSSFKDSYNISVLNWNESSTLPPKKDPRSQKDSYLIFPISSENGLKIQVIKSNGFGICTPRASAMLNTVPNRRRVEKIQSSFFRFFLTRGGTSIAIITADMIRMPTTATTTTPFSIDKSYDLQLSQKSNLI